MSVIEALVIYASGWVTEEERQIYIAAGEIVREARSEILRQHKPVETPKDIKWTP